MKASQIRGPVNSGPTQEEKMSSDDAAELKKKLEVMPSISLLPVKSR
jgi:hypothetical protein